MCVCVCFGRLLAGWDFCFVLFCCFVVVFCCFLFACLLVVVAIVVIAFVVFALLFVRLFLVVLVHTKNYFMMSDFLPFTVFSIDELSCC